MQRKKDIASNKKGIGLIPREKQAEHSQRVRVAILEFLLDETYTVPEVIQELVGYKSIQGANGVMKKLAKDGLLKHHAMKNFAGRGLNLWGITTRGIYAIGDPEELPERVRGFEPSRVSLSTLDHKLDIQRIKIYAATQGWEILKIDSDVWASKLPDILAVKPDKKEELICLEIELTIKSKKRYADIISTYREMKRSTGNLRRVVWLTESDKNAAQLHSIFKTLDPSCLELHKFMSLDAFKGKPKRGDK